MLKSTGQTNQKSKLLNPKKMSKKIYSLPQTNGINFALKYIEIEGHKHRVSLAGNKKGTPVILMMGVFEDSLADARWLVSNMVNIDKKRKFYFITITCLLYTSPSPRDGLLSRMPSSA